MSEEDEGGSLDGLGLTYNVNKETLKIVVGMYADVQINQMLLCRMASDNKGIPREEIDAGVDQMRLEIIKDIYDDFDKSPPSKTD